MADYPLAFARDGAVAAANETLVDIAGDGTPKIRRLWSATSYTLTLITRWIDSTDKATLDAFYAANYNAAVTVTIGSDSYSVYFSGPPQYESLNSTRWSATSFLVGNKA